MIHGESLRRFCERETDEIIHKAKLAGAVIPSWDLLALRKLLRGELEYLLGFYQEESGQ